MGLFLLLAALLTPAWDQIDILCVVRDAQGRALTNLTQDRFQVFDAGEARPITAFARATGKAHIITIDNPEGAYLAIMRQFNDADDRKVLIISGENKTPFTTQHNWELILLALRTHVTIYGAGGLATATGGRPTASLREIQADLDAEYRIVATPLPHGVDAGLYHALDVRVSGGARVQAPRSYYMAPPWDD